MTGDEVVARVEAHLRDVLGPDAGRAGVTFVGMERIEVLRFPDATGTGVTYVTAGMSRSPLPDGSRAELVLALGEPHDEVFKALAVLAASAFVDDVAVAYGTRVDLAEPLWPGAAHTAFRLGEPVTVPATDDVVFHDVVVA